MSNETRQGEHPMSFKFKVVVMAAGLAVGSVAMAEGLTKAQYEAQEKVIETDLKAAKGACDSLAGNTKDICVATAKGKAHVAKAELTATYKPSSKHTYAVREARAEAEYMVAVEHCDDKAGNDKDVCVKEAKAAKVRAMADAKTALETSKANTKANEATRDANAKAAATKTEVRRDAAEEKRDADYAVAKAKCDVLAGEAKDTCVRDAKVRFGKP
jgi:hypothetical protein